MKFKHLSLICLIFFFLAGPLVSKATNFNSPRQIPFPIAQYAVVSGDLNKDGIPDLIIGGDPIFTDPGKIRVGLGLGNGNFANWREYVIGSNPNFLSAPFVSKIEIADFNNDGSPDVAVIHNNARSQFSSSPLLATILFNNGQGILQPADSYRFFDATADNYANTMTIADLNADGKLDIVIGLFSENLGKLYFMKNLGNNTFSVIGPRVVIGPVTGLGTALVNNDQHVDVIYSTLEGIGILYMDGNFFSTSGIILEDRVQDGEIIVKDFNSDGKADLAVADFINPRIRVFMKERRGFSETPAVYNTNIRPERLKGYDVNRDEHTDLVFGGGLTGGVQILYGNAQGGFSLGDQIPTAPTSDITLNDFDLNGKTDIITANYSTVSNIQSQLFLNAPNPARYYTDFDGDRKSDLTVYRPGTGTWWILQSRSNNYSTARFGLATDKVVAGNYDGDSLADIAVYRDGLWYILQSSDGAVRIEYWGISEDIPVPADFDNDGKMNPAVYRPSEGIWYVKNETGFSAVRWGLLTDKPVAADYDGDGKADIAVYRPSEGLWYILNSSNNQITYQKFGLPEDQPVPSDFDGDGKADISVFRSSDGVWYILQSSSGTVRYQSLGLAGDKPVPNDFEGDGKSDIAVYRPGEGTWYFFSSANNSYNSIRWGISQDIPIRASN